MNLSGSCQKNYIPGSKPIWHHSKITPIHVSTSTSIFRKSMSRNKQKSIYCLLIQWSVQHENKLRPVLPTIIPINKVMRSITFGSASISARKTKKIKKLHLRNAILNLMLDILQQISSMRREEPFTVFSLQGDAVQVV
jgi:hypothetical protein